MTIVIGALNVHHYADGRVGFSPSSTGRYWVAMYAHYFCTLVEAAGRERGTAMWRRMWRLASDCIRRGEGLDWLDELPAAKRAVDEDQPTAPRVYGVSTWATGKIGRARFRTDLQSERPPDFWDLVELGPEVVFVKLMRDPRVDTWQRLPVMVAAICSSYEDHGYPSFWRPSTALGFGHHVLGLWAQNGLVALEDAGVKLAPESEEAP